MSVNGRKLKEKKIESVSDRFRDSLNFDTNKPDFRELDLVRSPVSPLRNGPTTSSSSGSSGSVSGRTGSTHLVNRSDKTPNHSGELSGGSESSPTAADSVRSGVKPTFVRSDSIGSHKSIVNSPIVSSSSSSSSQSQNVLPTGNICPSGKILKTGMTTNRVSKTDVLGSGSGNYGHGSIMRGGGTSKSNPPDANVSNSRTILTNSRRNSTNAGGELDSEEFKRVGNEQYKKGNFGEALGFYDKAISLSPGNAAYRSNRAAALTGLGKLNEAVKECEEAVRLDPGYWRAHHRVASLFIRLGQIENARRHMCSSGQQPDSSEFQKLQAVEKHLSKCSDARKINDWKSTLREVDAAITAGADSSPQLFTCRAEAFLKLHQLDEALSSLPHFPKFDTCSRASTPIRFFGIISEAYLFFVQAQIDLAFGRFESAVTHAEKAMQIDPRNVEVAVLLNNVRLVARARVRGNDLFKSERFTEACSAYGEGLRLDHSNAVLYCNRAACWFKLGLWERSIEDCNQALGIQPNYMKALLRRATSNFKLEKWVDAVRDYEVLRRELPNDNEVAEQLFHAQVAFKKSRGEEVYNMKFGGEVEEVSGIEQLRAAISSPGVSVVHFKATSNAQCEHISPFVDALCSQYPSVNFLKVDINECPAIASMENVRIIPTFKIYKNSTRVKEMICPSREVLENSVRHYCF